MNAINSLYVTKEACFMMAIINRKNMSIINKMIGIFKFDENL